MYKPMTSKQLAKKHAQIEARSRELIAGGTEVKKVQAHMWKFFGMMSEVKGDTLFCQLGLNGAYKWQVQL